MGARDIGGRNPNVCAAGPFGGARDRDAERLESIGLGFTAAPHLVCGGFCRAAASG
jgi:hypothetical protein